MFKKSDFFLLTAVLLSFLVSAFQWFINRDIDQAIFTAIWVPSILGLGMYFKLSALLGRTS